MTTDAEKNHGSTSYKLREELAYQEAARQGRQLVKSQRSDSTAEEDAEYILVTGGGHAGGLTKQVLAVYMLAEGEGVALDAIEAILYCEEIVVEAPNLEDPTELDYPENRIILFYSGGVTGWHVLLPNGGSPLDYRISMRADEKDKAVQASQEWARGYFDMAERNALEAAQRDLALLKWDSET